MWLTGKIEECNGVISFTIRLSDDHIVKHHIDHIRSHDNSIEVNSPSEPELVDVLPTPSTVSSQTSASSSQSVMSPLRCSIRIRHPPELFT